MSSLITKQCAKNPGILRKSVSSLLRKMSQYLAVFDYDHTVVDKNTDLVARDLIDASLIPDTVKNLYKSSGWIDYMQEIFNLLHTNHVTRDQIEKAIREIPETPGMVKCFQELRRNAFEVIVISDSNSVFIDTWNKNRIAESICDIFTNPARFDDAGKLLIQGYHHQTACTLSSENLCKGQVMQEFIEKRKNEGITFESVFYVGDGRNDICPMLRLGSNDFACPRVGYACEREIEQVARKVGKEIDFEIYRCLL
ncbi:pyridoxal phosphate phosphatase PHOSPHO2-like [Culicoides brevitarsis]|uniref:pyridoxal phosphate phosphatase PHOSPHO2-like n=1 Tax=Culicoides brevitarsis TaxID=469753 RepID=UPI00307B8E33